MKKLLILCLFTIIISGCSNMVPDRTLPQSVHSKEQTVRVGPLAISYDIKNSSAIKLIKVLESVIDLSAELSGGVEQCNK